MEGAVREKRVERAEKESQVEIARKKKAKVEEPSTSRKWKRQPSQATPTPPRLGPRQ